MDVAGDVIDIRLVPSGGQTISYAADDSSTKAGNHVLANLNRGSKTFTNSLKVSFDTELSGHRPTLDMNHFHEEIFSILVTRLVC